MMQNGSNSRIPVTLITGFLGAGKSTLLNALLRDPRFAGSAVLVNEFGDIGIDGALVRGVDETVITLSTGCICCAMRGEMITALRDLHFKRVRGEIDEFQRLVIETTGLADPAPILATLLGDPIAATVYRLDGIVAVIDGEHGEAHLDERAEARSQASIADRLLISKADRATPEALARLEARLGELNPFAGIRAMTLGDAPPEALVGAFAPSRRRDPPPEGGSDHRDGIRSAGFRMPANAPRAALASRIALFLMLNGGRILRFKAIARCDDGQLWAFHGVRHVAYPPEPVDDCPATYENRAVVISEAPPEHTQLLTEAN